MFKVRVQPEAVSDLLEMKKAGGSAAVCAARIVAIIEEIKCDPNLLKQLATMKFDTDDFEVGKYLQFWNDGIDLWKLKIFDFDKVNKKWWTLPYRVLYAYDMGCYTFRVLGILPREFDYKADHELTKRIIKTYNDLGLPKHVVTRSTLHRSDKLH